MRALTVAVAVWLGSACGAARQPADAGPGPGADGGPAADAGPRDAGPGDGGADAGFSFTVLFSGRLDSGVAVDLLRLERPGRAPSYAQWLPPSADGGARPVVVLTQPYDGIDWTTEPLDARWADGGAGLRPDVDGPAFDGGTIVYSPLSLEAAVDSAAIWRLHDFGVLLVFGRYYAGGDVQNDIDDMTAGFEFLARAPRVDRGRVGILGGSWGGFEALYGAAYARADVTPRVGVALYPVSDFRVERDFVTQVLPARYALQATRDASAAFFSPYLHRIDATVARQGGYAGLTASDLVARLSTTFLVLHEDWDTLVSFEQSQALVALAPQRFKPLWLLHGAAPAQWDALALKHGQLLSDFASDDAITFSVAYLLLGLGDPNQQLLVPWHAARFRMLMSLMRARQVEGTDVRFFAERLLELTDPRVVMYEVSTAAATPGIATVTAELNAVWGTQLTTTTVQAALDGGLP